MQIKVAVPSKKSGKAANPKIDIVKSLLQVRPYAAVVKCDKDDDVVVIDDDNDHTSCAPTCLKRWSDGSCRTWGPDTCGTDDDPIKCSPRCLKRWSDGSCQEWGSDQCGEGSECVKQCIERWSDGSCRTWGEDVCG